MTSSCFMVTLKITTVFQETSVVTFAKRCSFDKAYDKGYVFSLSTTWDGGGGGGAYPCSRFFLRSLIKVPFWGVPQSQVLSQVTGPKSFSGGTPVLAGQGTPVLAEGQRTPWPGQDWGTPPPQPGQDEVPSLAMSGWGTPGQVRMRYPPPG